MSLNTIYARMMFRLDFDKRMNLYRKIASLLRNDFTLMNALDRCWQVESKNGRKRDEPFALALSAWQDGLERGMSFGEAVSKWTPGGERLMLAASDVSRLSESLEMLTTVAAGTSRIKKALTNAVAYPMFLFAMTAAIVALVGLYLVPPLSDAAGGDVVWRGTAASLVAVAEISNAYWPHFLMGTAAAIVWIWHSLANMSGPLRVLLDNFPPWSMYKISVSVSWLSGLSAMVAGGVSLPAAMKMLSDSGSKYLRGISFPAERFIENGDNLGRALARTKRHFPDDEIIGDLEIYAEMNEFDKNLAHIANDYMERSVRRMEKLSSILNGAGIILVSSAIAWVVFGTFDMQEQITAALT